MRLVASEMVVDRGEAGRRVAGVGVDAKSARPDVVKDSLDFVVVNDVLDGAPAAACPPPAAAPSPTELQQPGTPPGNLPKLQQPKAWPA